MKNRTNVRWLTQLALLVAILLVLNYTPLGYLQIGPLSASLLTVPVAIGAMTMNPMAGAILGGVFGATSFIQAVEGKSAMGAALFQVSPAGTFVVCFVARVLMGLCTALIFNAVIIPCLIPLALRGVKYRPMSSGRMLARNMMLYGLGGVIAPFAGIKLIDMLIHPLLALWGF